MILITVLLMIGAYSLGVAAGEFRANNATSARLQQIFTALKKVTDLATLRGEDISKLSDSELMSRIQKQLEVHND